MESLQYPIGRFSYPKAYSNDELAGWVSDIKRFPAAFRSQVEAMTDEQLDQSYRPDGWTARQVIHHVPDSHLNAYCRFKLVLTEDSPTIKPYLEDRWANLDDTKLTPPATSLQLLDALHERWGILLDQMLPSDFDKYYVHPEYGRQYKLGAACKLYAWHGKHHLAHLKVITDQA